MQTRRGRRRCGRSWPAPSGSGTTTPWSAAPLRPADVYARPPRLARHPRSSWPATAFLIVAAVARRRAVAVGACWPSRPRSCARLAFAAPAHRVRRHAGDRPRFALVMRFLVAAAVPVLGHVLPAQPAARRGCRPLAWVSPLWHGVELCRSATTGTLPLGGALGAARRTSRAASPSSAPAFGGARAPSPGGWRHDHPDRHRRRAAVPSRPAWTRLLPGASVPPPFRLVERNIVAWRGMWLVFVSVLLEPILFLLSIGVGVGALVGDVTGPAAHGALPRLRGRRSAGDLGAMIGPGLRLDLQLLRQAQVLPPLRRGAGHADAPDRRRHRRGAVVAAARRDLRHGASW